MGLIKWIRTAFRMDDEDPAPEPVCEKSVDADAAEAELRALRDQGHETLPAYCTDSIDMGTRLRTLKREDKPGQQAAG